MMVKEDKTHLAISQAQWGYLRDHSTRRPLPAFVNLGPGYDMSATSRYTNREQGSHMDGVIESASIDRCAICTPGYGSDRTAEFIYRHRFLPRVVSPFPHAHGAIIACRGEEFYACASCESPVKRVDDLAVGAKFAHALAGG